VAAVGKDNGKYTIVVDDTVWGDAYDMVWSPVFSPDSRNVAAKVEKDGCYTIVMNGRSWRRESEALWNVAFSPDGSKVLVCAVEEGKYYRRVMPITEITG